MTTPEYVPQPVNEGYEAPVMTPEESNEANDGYTLKTWTEYEAMYLREDVPDPANDDSSDTKV